MKVPVQKRARRSGRRLAFFVVLGGLVTAIALIAGYTWVGNFATREITAMGGVAAPGGTVANLERLFNEAWPRQRAARSDAPDLPHVSFNLRRRDIGKLATKRASALQAGYLMQGTDDYVDAEVQMIHGDRKEKASAKIRLKGDFVDHIRGDKWSFRVRTRGDQQILGMRVFSIQHPKVRGYAYETFALEHMRAEGVLAPRYEFVRVTVNGRDKGIMALEEHFSKEMLESQRRRESVIVRFDETLKWRTVALMGQMIDFSAPYPLITPFRSGKVEKNPALKRDYEQAVALMRGFLSKNLKPSEVFDPDITARFLAVAEIWGAEHALAWNNMRFYFNPITGLLEPIAFDCNLQDAAFRYIPTALVSVYRLADNITADWLEDPGIRQPFLAHMSRISKAHVPETIWDKHKVRETELHKILHQEFPLIADIGFGFYRLRAMRLATVDANNFRSQPLEFPNYPTLMHAFVHPSREGFELELYNLVPYPVEVRGATFTPASVTASRPFPITLPATVGKAAPVPIRITLRTPEDIASIQATLDAIIPGYANSRKSIESRNYSATANGPVLPNVSWSQVLLAHGSYLKRNGDTLELGPGRVQIDRPLVLPLGASLTIAPGTTVRFGPKALIFARGPVHMRGTAAAPIDLGPTDVGWHGIAVMNAAGVSKWSHTRIHRTTGLELGRWSTTGSVMFYASPVEMRDCTLADNSAEDMLNFVRTDFDIDRITMTGCVSDALDADFCKGTVRNMTMRDIGGDGIDVSGTVIEIDGLRCERVKDKAVSAGERSTVTARAVHAQNCGTGVASKDASRVRLRESSFEDMSFISLIAFMKKPEYGPGHIDAETVTMTGAGAAARAQTGSSIRVNGKVIPAEKLDVDALYRVGPMQKDGNAPQSSPQNSPSPESPQPKK